MASPFPASHLLRQAPPHARQAGHRALRTGIMLVPVALLLAIGYLAMDLWSQMPAAVAPRHRAEALCFALACPDLDTHERFVPAMRIEPSVALVQGRFAPGTAAGLALREMMRFDETMVIEESQRMVGDYLVSVLWLDLPPDRAPEGSNPGHWLVLAWMEGSDVAVCNFHFAGGAGPELSPDERHWGARLLDRVLVPENFRAGSLPRVRLRVMQGGSTMPVFGPAPATD